MLSPTAKKALRTEITYFCKQAELYEARWHYTQQRPFGGFGAAPQTYHWNDCSGYVSLVFYWAGRHSGHPVFDPLGGHYSGLGNTETIITTLEAHHAPLDKYMVGDICVFGTRGVLSTQHTIVCKKNGTRYTSLWSSHGEEAGPEQRLITDDRRATIGVYRHPALL